MRHTTRLLLLSSLLLSAGLTAHCQEHHAVILSDTVPQQIIYHTGYTVSYNADTHTPNWVSWELSKERASATTVSRSGNDFLPDPQADDGMDTRHYSHSGYQRGHMCPAADNKMSETAMRESFYLTNICPQDGVLNEGLWNELEQRCRYLAKKHGSLTIVCGPVFGADFERIGQKGIGVPQAFFKAVLGPGNELIGFIMPNAPEDPEKDIFSYAVPVDRIEELTGIDLFPELPDSIEDKAEKSFDKQFWEIRNWKKK